MSQLASKLLSLGADPSEYFMNPQVRRSQQALKSLRLYEPLRIDPKGDFFPHVPRSLLPIHLLCRLTFVWVPMSLLEIVPKVSHPFLSRPTPLERESN